MTKHITTREIARVLKLHYSTVSLGLRDSPLLKAATKQKIQEAARRLGYKPDPMLNALSAYRLSKRPAPFHGVLGWINSWRKRDQLLANPAYKVYYEGACDCAKKLGYDIQEFWMHEAGMAPRKLEGILKARNIQGMLIPPIRPPDSHVDIDFTDFFVVTFGYSMQPRNMHLVTNHHAQCIDLIMSKIAELGYRRPGYCCPPSSDIGNNYIWLTRALYLTERYPTLSQLPRPPLERKGFAKWLDKNQPDVLIAFGDLLPMVESLGYRVPRDVGFVSVAVNPHDAYISGANQNDFLIGQTAVNVLVGMINHQERGVPEIPIRTLVDSVWFPGKTVRQQDTAGTARKRDRRIRPTLSTSTARKKAVALLTCS
jgi:LacI family transcriptional regulator